MKSIGKYFIFLYAMFVHRISYKIYFKQIMTECVTIGLNSLLLITIISGFMGAVTAMQTASHLSGPFFQDFLVGLIVRDMTFLELAPTICSIVLAGKIGSHTAGQLGAMRITEQIDALEVMGINASTYLVLPKIIAALCMYPLLVIIANFLSILGGLLASKLLGIISAHAYIEGLKFQFHTHNIFFGLSKSIVFAFLIASIAAYKGFYVRGGAFEVGKASTQAVTNSCIAILIADYILTQLFL